MIRKVYIIDDQTAKVQNLDPIIEAAKEHLKKYRGFINDKLVSGMTGPLIDVLKRPRGGIDLIGLLLGVLADKNGIFLVDIDLKFLNHRWRLREKKPRRPGCAGLLSGRFS